MTFLALKEGDWFKFANMGEVKKALPKFKDKFWIEFKPDPKIRSVQQNRYYWGVVIAIISEHTGEWPHDVHEGLKQKFLSRSMFKDDKVILQYSRSTSSITTTEYEWFLSNIRMWASSELGLFIPLPNEVLNNETIDSKSEARGLA